VPAGNLPFEQHLHRLLEAPTFSPSILVRTHDGRICHSYLRDGVWEFLTDSTHHLAGTSVPCVPIPPGWFDQ
jgi:hypothetical protein